MRLYLAQHGEAAAKETDPSRPLTARGRLDVGRMAAFLGAGGVRVGRVIHSRKTRAQETAEILAGSLLAPDARDVRPAPGLCPTDPVAPVAEKTREWPDDTLIAGHQPFMGRLVSLLVGRAEDASVVAYSPGTVVCLERAEDGTWCVVWMVRPELLPG